MEGPNEKGLSSVEHECANSFSSQSCSHPLLSGVQTQQHGHWPPFHTRQKVRAVNALTTTNIQNKAHGSYCFTKYLQLTNRLADAIILRPRR